MRWLALHFSHLQLDSICSLIADREGGKGGAPKAMVVLDNKQRVCQWNSTADSLGITRGMKLGTVSALAEDLQFFDYSQEFEQQRLTELAQDCYHVSADIVLWRSDTLIFDVMPMLKLYGSFEHYSACLFQTESLSNVSVSAVVADTPLAAYLLSCLDGIDIPLTEQFQRKDRWWPVLDRLPITSAGLTVAQQSQLKRLGLRSLGDLRQLMAERSSRNELGNRLGKALVSHVAQLFGEEPVTITYFKPKDIFVHSLLLEYEVLSSTALLFPLKNLLQCLHAYLQRRTKRVQSLSVYLSQREGRLLSFELASAEPERDSQRWLTLMQLKLESLVLPAPVVALRLEALTLLDDTVQSSDLFDAKPTLLPGQLIARMQAKLGRESVRGICFEGDHRPEYSFCYPVVRSADDLLALNAGREGAQEKQNDSKHLHCLRPSFILPNPVPLEENVRFVHGPERIQSAWWSDHPVCRDYFVARNTRQQTLWVFRDRSQQWFVHGLFA